MLGTGRRWGRTWGGKPWSARKANATTGHGIGRHPGIAGKRVRHAVSHALHVRRASPLMSTAGFVPWTSPLCWKIRAPKPCPASLGCHGGHVRTNGDTSRVRFRPWALQALGGLRPSFESSPDTLAARNLRTVVVQAPSRPFASAGCMARHAKALPDAPASGRAASITHKSASVQSRMGQTSHVPPSPSRPVFPARWASSSTASRVQPSRHLPSLTQRVREARQSPGVRPAYGWAIGDRRSFLLGLVRGRPHPGSFPRPSRGGSAHAARTPS